MKRKPYIQIFTDQSVWYPLFPLICLHPKIFVICIISILCTDRSRALHFLSMSVHSFIAHFLKENGFTETLRTFEEEYGKPISTTLPHEEDLADIITDRMKYLSTQEAPLFLHEHLLSADLKAIKDAEIKEWSAPYPQKGTELARIDDLVVSSIVFKSDGKRYVLAGTSGMSLVVVDLDTGAEKLVIKSVIGKVVIRKIVVTAEYVLLCGMNGKVYMGEFTENMLKFTMVAEEQIHARLVTDVKVVKWNGKDYLVSMGWDLLVKVHEIVSTGLVPVGEPYKLGNQGCCMDACVYKDKLIILAGKNEITLLDVISMDKELQLKLEFKIALNDAEFSASGFTPRCIRILTSENGIPLVAVGTSHEPYMRLIVVTLKELNAESPESIKRNQIITNINTLSPQDKYSQAHIEWRYDGSGVWIMGEDGVVRGLDISKEEVILLLSEHDGRIKTASVADDVIITCGTDRRVIRWT